MKYLLRALAVTIVGIMSGAVSAGAQTETSTVILNDFLYCGIADHPGPKTLYVVQRFSTGSSRISFRIQPSPGFTGTLVSFSSTYTVAGDPSTGAVVSFGSCASGNVQVMQLNYMFFGTSQPCSWIRVVPDQFSSSIVCLKIFLLKMFFPKKS